MPKCGRFSEAEKRGICDNGVDFGKKKNKKTAKSKHPIRKKKKRENPNPQGSAARDHGRSSPKWKPSCGQTRDQTRDQIW